MLWMPVRRVSPSPNGSTAHTRMSSFCVLPPRYRAQVAIKYCIAYYCVAQASFVLAGVSNKVNLQHTACSKCIISTSEDHNLKFLVHWDWRTAPGCWSGRVVTNNASLASLIIKQDHRMSRVFVMLLVQPTMAGASIPLVQEHCWRKHTAGGQTMLVQAYPWCKNTAGGSILQAQAYCWYTNTFGARTPLKQAYCWYKKFAGVSVPLQLVQALPARHSVTALAQAYCRCKHAAGARTLLVQVHCWCQNTAGARKSIVQAYWWRKPTAGASTALA